MFAVEFYIPGTFQTYRILEATNKIEAIAEARNYIYIMAHLSGRTMRVCRWHVVNVNK